MPDTQSIQCPGCYRFPPSAKFGARLPKEKIYQNTRPGNKQRQLMINQVESMIWQYKLAPETINVPAMQPVLEIQVIDIALKDDIDELDEAVMRLIDKAIPHPIYYRIFTADRVQCIMAWKRQHESSAGQWVTESYHRTPWLRRDNFESAAQALPLMGNLTDLYEAMLRTLIDEPPKQDESLVAQMRRIESLGLLNNQLQQLTRQLKREKQFNRKVEINSEINKVKRQIASSQAGSA